MVPSVDPMFQMDFYELNAWVLLCSQPNSTLKGQHNSPLKSQPNSPSKPTYGPKFYFSLSSFINP